MKKIVSRLSLFLCVLLLTGCAQILNPMIQEIRYERDGFDSPAATLVQDSPFKKEITIKWNGMKGVSYYKVFYSTTSNFRDAKALTTKRDDKKDKYSYTHKESSFEYGKNYYYWVVAYTANEFSSDIAKAASITFSKKAETNVNVYENDNNREIIVSWNSISGATGYYVYYNNTDDFTTAVCANLNRIKYTETKTEYSNLRVGLEYYFWVIATDGSIETEPGKSTYFKSIGKTDLGKITDLKFENSSGTLQLTWTYSNDADYVNIYRNTENNYYTSQIIDEKKLAMYKYKDYTAAKGNTYYYWVIPADYDGNEAALEYGSSASVTW